MKISLNWIKEFTEVNLTVDRLVEKIGAQLGAVEEVIALGKKYRGIVIAKVVSCENHPNADKLKVCTIDDNGKTPAVKRDKEGLVQVVCGAPNVKAGMLVAWLPPGASVPATYDKEPLKLEAREIRGVISYGMLASGHELSINDDHDGILELSMATKVYKKDIKIDINDHVAALSNIVLTPSLKPGDDFSSVYKMDDYILDIENKMFTHRPDCFGIIGVAREIAGITGQKFVSPKWYIGAKTSGEHDKDKHLLEIINELPKLVPRFMAQVIEDVKVGPSPLQVQTYLSRLGIRPINNIVDATNYLMVLTGQPMHAYDYDKVKTKSRQQKVKIVIRHPKKGETIELLGGKVINPRTDAIMIATDKEPIGIGGVMGGAGTEVDANTKNIILECANFDMYSIRRTAMEHGLFTDAVTRFTKGQSPLQCGRVLAGAVDQILCNAGGLPARSIYDIKNDIRPLVAVHVTSDFINARLGFDLSIKDMAKLLENVEFTVTINGPTLVVTPPFWRTDIEIPEDVVEEIGRLYGYDHLPLELPKRSVEPARKDALVELKRYVRDTLSASGANEVLTYSFVHGNLIEKVGQDRTKAFQLSNALSPDLQFYRLSLTPSLLEKVHPNIKSGHDQFAIYEIGRRHQKGSMDKNDLPVESETLALVFAASNRIAAKQYSGSPIYQAKAYLMQMLWPVADSIRIIKLNDYTGKKIEHDEWLKPYDRERSGLIVLGNEVIGVVGEFPQSVTKQLKLPDFCAGFEVSTGSLTGKISSRKYVPLSRYPSVDQDISLRVPSHVNYGELLTLLDKIVGDLKPQHSYAVLQPLDIYKRAEDTEHKQITLRLTIKSYQKTLTDTEVNNMLDEAAKKAEDVFKAKRI